MYIYYIDIHMVNDEPSKQSKKRRFPSPLTIMESINLDADDIETLSKTPEEQIADFIADFITKTREIIVQNPGLDDHSDITVGTLFSNIHDELKQNAVYNFETGFEHAIDLNNAQLQGVKQRPHANFLPNKKAYLFSTSNIYKRADKKPTIIKQYCLAHINDVDAYVQGYLSIIHEVCMQYYARQLVMNSINNNVVVPQLYGIKLTTARIDDNDHTCIDIYMEKLPDTNITSDNIETIITPEFFNMWNPIITNTFNNFVDNHLLHLDTASRNVYFATINGIRKLVVIDFGESLLDFEKTILKRPSQATGYKIGGYTDIAEFKKWVLKQDSAWLSVKYGGIVKKRTKRNKRTKHNKRRV